MSRNTSDIYKASINILGSCVTRDIFFTHHNDGGYRIFQYVNFFSPISLCEGPVFIDLERYNSSDFSEYATSFRKRCVMHDLTKQSIDYIAQKKTDWLILDTGLFRRNLCLLGDKKQTCFAEKEDFLKYLSKQKIIPEIVGEIIIEDISDEDLEKRMKFFIDKILAMYPMENIVLIEAKNSLIKADNSGNISGFDDVDYHMIENNRMSRCYKLMKNMLQGCHIIPMPENVVADAEHRLGLSPLHYTMGYYDYALSVFDCIQKKLPIEKEQSHIQKLFDKCNMDYAGKYFSALADSYINLSKQKNQSELKKIYKKCKKLIGR